MNINVAIGCIVTGFIGFHILCLFFYPYSGRGQALARHGHRMVLGLTSGLLRESVVYGLWQVSWLASARRAFSGGDIPNGFLRWLTISALH